MFENAESILRFYEENIILHVIRHEVKDKRVCKLFHRGEDDTNGSADMSSMARSSHLGTDPFGDDDSEETVTGLKPEQLALLHNL